MTTDKASTPRDSSFEELYQHAPCGLLSTTPDGEIIDVNETLIAWTGHPRDFFVGNSFSSVLDLGSRLFYETRHLPVLRLHGEVRAVALSVRCSDDSQLPVLVNSVIVTDESGQPAVVRTALFDATERNEFERELIIARRSAESSEERFRALQDVSSALESNLSVEGVAAALATTARNAFAAMATAVLLFDGDGQLELIAGSNPLDGSLRDDELQSLADSRLVTISTIHATEVSVPRVADALRLARIDGMSIVPLRDEHASLGLLVCFFGREREFDTRFRDLQQALARQASQALTLVRLQRELERLALHDQLTGLVNRKVIQEDVARAIDGSLDTGRPMAVIFLDLDGFKLVNDVLGHAAGDDVLRQIARRLRSSIRVDDSVGRFGGDEFVAICGDADEAAARSIAERILAAVDAPLDGIPDVLRVTASAGVAIFAPDSGEVPSVDGLLNSADNAMYRSKNSGKNTISFVSGGVES